MDGWSERVMGQTGLFDVERRLEAISAKGDPLETIKKIVPWEDFRTDIEAVTETKPEERKSNAGRKPYDAILKFKILVLQSLHNLSDEQTEYLIRDRWSFMRFLDLGLEDPVPDATTIWLFREALAQAGLIDKLFARFGQHLEAEGYIARGGQIIDASIVSVPKQRNTKEETEAIKAGKTPEGWEKQPAKNAQKDKDARWTKKNESFYGYKNHLGVDKAHKLIRKWDATCGRTEQVGQPDEVIVRVNLNLKCATPQHEPRETTNGLGPAERLISALALGLIARGEHVTLDGLARPMGPSSAAPLTKHPWQVKRTPERVAAGDVLAPRSSPVTQPVYMASRRALGLRAKRLGGSDFPG
jgi:transposase, IS5 family